MNEIATAVAAIAAMFTGLIATGFTLKFAFQFAGGTV